MKISARHIAGFIAGILFVVGLVSIFSRSRAPSAIKTSVAGENINLSCVCCGAIQPDQALFWALVDRGVPPRIVDAVGKSLSSVLDMRKIYPGDSYMLEYSPAGRMKRFELVRSPWEKYIVCPGDSAFIAIKDTIPLTRTVFAAEGIVENTLWGSMLERDIEPEAIMSFTDVLAYDFDFVTDTRNGHRFRIAYEKIAFRDSIVGIGKILLADYITSDKAHTAVFYCDPDGRKGYFNLKCKSMKKSLLKTPLSYRRISSHFSYRRFHPILKIYKPHLGVDYAAPSGTPVVASGHGKVIFAGNKGANGNMVKIKHNNGIETYYLHLSRFAKGIRNGVRVKRGQVIAYVGSTGRSTGPHLDYRVKVDGKFVNPEKYAFPAEPPVTKKYRDEYLKYAHSILEGTAILAADPKKEENISSIQ